MTSIDYPELCFELIKKMIVEDGVIKTVEWLHDGVGLNRMQLIDLYFCAHDLDRIAAWHGWLNWDPDEA